MTIWLPQLEGRPEPRYRAIADAIDEDVLAGRLRPGERLPTHRELAERLRVTVGTVSRAYAEAARRGLLSGEVGRGSFVRSWPEPPVPIPDRPGVVDLSRNHPPDSGNARRALHAVLSGLTTRGDLGPLLAYPPDGGHPAHRAAGAAWIARTGLDAPPERVVVCSGSQHGLTTVLATILEPGDLVLSESLTYPGLKAAASLLRLRLRGLPLDGEGLRPDAFEDACRRGDAKALHCVPTIQNPTTSVMSAARRREIAAIARAHGVAVIEDDTHALLPEPPLTPVSAHAPEISYYLVSTSKMLAPGLRIGYVLAPAGMVDRLAVAIRATAWATAPLMAEIATAWLGDGTADAILADRRREASARQELARRALGGVEHHAHPVGYHVWLPLPAPWRSESFTVEARRRGVAVTPAEAFLVGRDQAPHAVRICLGAARSREELETGLKRVAETLAAPPEPGLALV
jgi:DNA-binding transcriptional MocR family regulator